MRVVVLGGDGFCGWPCVLHLAAHGHEVILVDNLSRRAIDIELECESLTPIRPISERLAVWKALSGREVPFVRLDVARDYHRLLQLLQEARPDGVVHFAEQRAAPYSMKSVYHRRYTVENNLHATHNLLAAIVEAGLDTHVVHLGSIGAYGYRTAGIALPEGYVTMKLSDGRGGSEEREALYPADPDSVYHMTKAQDQLFFHFYNKNHGLRITELNQGIVWGTQTPETRLDERLINRFDYDGYYGTVLNRFLMQAAIGHPLTVYGTGGQTRGFIHIQNSVECVRLALETPPAAGERVRILNQVTETHRVRDLARLVASQTGVPIDFLPNPRREAPENELRVANEGLLALGLEPVTLNEGLMAEVTGVAARYAHRCDPSKILPRYTWA